MKYQSVLDFVAVVECNTYPDAIKKLKLTKAEIIKLIRQLEKEFDTQLIKVGTSELNEIDLTEFGTMLYQSFKKYTLIIKKEVENSVKDIEHVKGTVRVLMPQFIFLEISDFFVEVHKVYPLVKFDVNFYDGVTLDYKTDLDYDLIIHNGTPELSVFYIHKVGEIVQKLFCTNTFIEKYGPIIEAKDLATAKFAHSIVCTEWLNKLVLQNVPTQTEITIPDTNIVAIADNLYDILYRDKIDDFIFVANHNKKLYEAGYVNILPEYYVNRKEVFLFRNKFRDSALVVNIQKRLKAALGKCLESFEVEFTPTR